MEDTFFFLPENQLNRMGPVYLTDEAGFVIRAIADSKVLPLNLSVFSASYPHLGPRTYFSGGAGLNSTRGDLACCLKMLVQKGKIRKLSSRKKVRILKRRSVDRLLRLNADSDLPSFLPGFSFGHGFAIHDDPAASGSPLSESSV